MLLEVDAALKTQIETLKRNDELTQRYFKYLSLNRIQFNRFMPGAGRHNSTHPSGTGKGVSRHARSTISGRSRRVTNMNIAVGGARGYHDRPFKKLHELSKKQKLMAIRGAFVKALLYKNARYVKEALDYKALKQLLPAQVIQRSFKKVNRAYSSYRKAVVIVHSDMAIHGAYKKKPGFRTINISSGQNYRDIQIHNNSEHFVIFTQNAIKILKSKYL